MPAVPEIQGWWQKQGQPEPHRKKGIKNNISSPYPSSFRYSEGMAHHSTRCGKTPSQITWTREDLSVHVFRPWWLGSSAIGCYWKGLHGSRCTFWRMLLSLHDQEAVWEPEEETRHWICLWKPQPWGSTSSNWVPPSSPFSYECIGWLSC